MRHGIAAERVGPFASNDAKRPLTAKGRKRTRQIATGLDNIGVRFDWIISSPLVRARETAEIVAAASHSKPPVELSNTLRPGGSLDEIISLLAKNGSSERVLLVGHEPDLSSLAARLIGAGGVANLTLKKGGCCLIRFDGRPAQSAGELLWWATPRMLRSFR
jgi:phosphohistidine phosphatase